MNDNDQHEEQWMAGERWVLGIDFGTSYTVAAGRRDGSPAELIEIDGERRLPSVLVVADDGAIHVGRAADDLASANAGRVVRAPKSRLGDPAPIVIAGRPQPVDDLVSALLAHVYAETVRWAGRPPAEVRVTHPATWGGPRRQQLLEIARTAGLPDPVLVPEPVAAAVAYADEAAIPDGGHVLVYDLGGGTFDTAALQATENGFVLVGRPSGDARLGGELFDELLVNHLGEQLDPATWEALQISDERTWQRAADGLRREARRVREALSGVIAADAVVALPAGMAQLPVTRDELDALIRPHLDESVELLRQTAAAAGLTPEAIDAIYLVGGASRTPLVDTLVAEAFPGVPRSRRGDTKAVVALGATHPQATPSRLAQHTSLDQLPGPGVAPTVATPDPVPPPPPPAGTIVESAGTVVEPSETRVDASPVMVEPTRRTPGRVVVLVAALVVTVLGVAGLALTVGGDDDDPEGAETTLAAGQQSDPTTATTTPPTEPTTPTTVESIPPAATSTTIPSRPVTTTPVPTTTTAPAAPPAPADLPTMEQVSAAVLLTGDLGEGFQELSPGGILSPVCGRRTDVEDRFSAASNSSRNADSTDVQQVIHLVVSYPDVASARADYEFLQENLADCQDETAVYAGYTYELDIQTRRFEDPTFPPSCGDIQASLYTFTNPSSPVPTLYLSTSVVRCGLNTFTIGLIAIEPELAGDEVLISSAVAEATTRLLALPGSLLL